MKAKIQAIVDEVAESILEGGPGSGPQPGGSDRMRQLARASKHRTDQRNQDKQKRGEKKRKGERIRFFVKQQFEDKVVKLFLEGGPGSGRYPEGSGKNPDAGGKVQWHQPWDESKRDSPKVDYDKTVRKIRDLKKKIAGNEEKIAHAKAKVADIDSKGAKVKELEAQLKELAGKAADAHQRGAEAKAKAEEHKANAQALRAEYKRRWGKDLK